MLNGMAEDRPKIPMEIQRAVLVEAGHRCAIQTCRQTPVDLAHIQPWAQVRTHTFDNLIALCPTCHRRFDRGEIDRKAMRQYKANLEILNHRYSDLERQLLRMFVRRRQIREGTSDVPRRWPEFTGLSQDGLWPVEIDRGMWWTVSNLVEDGVILLDGPGSGAPRRPQHPRMHVSLTPKGSRLVQRIAEGEPI
ncbi:HNH endonuclease [Streptomyces sp. NPDC057592]|uniref:HNH endonuclease n=1 Tax=unclassified Streptomyces TaxID=2593676 RepID=UPI0036CE9E04